ncbi:MAG: rRNA maturation RNase YbeY [Paludibacteraceae bacterium]|nr:rRNA maturation RNase YbeY [Paludibacteraceae bacterium]MEE1085445.1 rRNA maturation RNase YbeY [Paludibacteraceae bacterium]
MAIIYEKEHSKIKMPKIKKRNVSAWIKKVAELHGKKVGDLSYLFCSDDHILEVNKEYLQHDYYTDIITFDYTEGDVISGDMVISVDTIATNAEKFNTSFESEFFRVVIHGVLHLCGINDKGPGEREIMEQHEDEALEVAKSFELVG